MKRIGTALRAAVSLGLCAALLAGCSLLPADPAPEQPVPTDPLTGQEQLWPGQRPVAVSIENASDSTTQWGLSAASVVLEARTELQGSTRLCLVYPSVNAVPQVGPVAAGEDLYWRLLVGQQVIPVQRGGGQFDQNYLDYYSLRPVDALEAGRNAFSCPAGVEQRAPLVHQRQRPFQRAGNAEHLLHADRIPGDDGRFRGGGQRLRGGRTSDHPGPAAPEHGK